MLSGRAKELKPTYMQYVSESINRHISADILKYFEHPQGTGRLVHAACTVQFTKIVPCDINRTPFVIWLSYGCHTHAPPPPSRNPKSIINNFRVLISQCSTNTLTFGNFEQSAILQEYLKDRGVSCLAELHQGLALKDRVSVEILRQRLLAYPNGTQLNGVLLEYEHQRLNPDKVTIAPPLSNNYLTNSSNIFRLYITILTTSKYFASIVSKHYYSTSYFMLKSKCHSKEYSRKI